MTSIAYIDHSYHKKTSSTKFLPALLKKHGYSVDWFWDESWHGGKAVKWQDIENYDVIIMFQSFSPIFGGYYAKKHACVTYIPMLDQFGIWNGPLFNLTGFWKPFHGIKVLSFSTSLHCAVTSFGIKSKCVKYYKKPIEEKIPDKGLHGFIWIRKEDEISWSTVKKLIKGTHFDSFHLHIASDPNSTDVKLPDKDEIKQFNITISQWFHDKKDFESVLKASNVFFAPRMEEGIGQSFLEALARGQCVVAPNNGTMNEYIQDGLTGLLYDWENPRPLDFSDVYSIAAMAHKSCIKGYENWLRSHDGIIDFILMPNEYAYLDKYNYFTDSMGENGSMLKNKGIYFLKQKLRSIFIIRKAYNWYKKR